MSNTQLVKKYRANSKKMSKIVDTLIKLGCGHITPLEMRCMVNKSIEIQEYLNLLDECSELKNEAELRYGPGLYTIDQLIWK